MKITKTLFLYDAQTGEFNGVVEAYPSPSEPGVFFEPVYSTNIEPPVVPDGTAAHFVNGVWELQRVPQPQQPPQPTTAEIRRAEIMAALSDLDAKSVRPLREGDAVRVAALENAAVMLRLELAAV